MGQKCPSLGQKENKRAGGGGENGCERQKDEFVLDLRVVVVVVLSAQGISATLVSVQ